MYRTAPPRTLSNSAVRRSRGTRTRRQSAATATMFDWIVKKLKKFPFA
jgi:hypothetical protein